LIDFHQKVGHQFKLIRVLFLKCNLRVCGGGAGVAAETRNDDFAAATVKIVQKKKRRSSLK
jgi:hypothetical protein